jgi:ATP-dependent exoDNAse (exonuclease V) beta subunit
MTDALCDQLNNLCLEEDILSVIHNDILGKILKCLCIQDIGKMAQTSKKYHKITHSYWWVNFKNYLTPENTSYLTIDSFTQEYPLSVTNKHFLDNYIQFQEQGHIYYIYNKDGTLSELPRTSVTTLIHDCFPQFDSDKIISEMMARKSWPNSQYYGMSPEEIKLKWKLNGEKSASSGTYMHFNIECHQNGINVIDPSIQFGYYMDFWNDFRSKYPQFKPYRTEMLIHYKGFRLGTMNLCGSVDFLLEDDDGNMIIMDWKHSKEIKKRGYNGQKGYPPFEHLDNCNLNHYNLQLNIYRHILEKIYNKNVIFMMLVIFHYNQKTYRCIAVDEMDMESVWDKI